MFYQKLTGQLKISKDLLNFCDYIGVNYEHFEALLKNFAT